MGILFLRWKANDNGGECTHYVYEQFGTLKAFQHGPRSHRHMIPLDFMLLADHESKVLRANDSIEVVLETDILLKVSRPGYVISLSNLFH